MRSQGLVPWFQDTSQKKYYAGDPYQYDGYQGDNCDQKDIDFNDGNDDDADYGTDGNEDHGSDKAKEFGSDTASTTSHRKVTALWQTSSGSCYKHGIVSEKSRTTGRLRRAEGDRQISR